MEDKKVMKKAKDIFTSLKTDSKSVLFSKEKIGSRLPTKKKKKKKKSKHEKKSLLLKLIQLTGNNFNEEKKIPTRADYVEK